MPAGAGKLRALDRYATVLHDLTSDASAAGLTLALENAGVLAQSGDLWLVRDAVGSPALRVCLNPLNADLAGDPPTRALKRMSGMLAMVRLSCTRPFPQDGTERFVEVDHAASNIVFILEQLKGLAYRGWVCLDRAPAVAGGPSADELLENGARFLRTELDKAVTELTAYKGDKNAPRFVSPAATS
jgi:sugar phosphate isomerase/epimerase